LVEQELPDDLKAQRAAWLATANRPQSERPPGSTYVPNEKEKDTQLQHALKLLRQ
jgi:hypothetical protein